MVLYKDNKKIQDVGEYGIYYGNMPIKEVYKGSQLIYQFIPSNTILFEQGTPGTYTFTAPYTCTVSVVLVGGGGGGAFCHFMAWEQGANGGSAGMVTGTTKITKGSNYTIVVGGGGIGGLQIDSGSNARAATGGNSSAFGNTANGGGGAAAHTGYYDGGWNTPGTAGGYSAVSGFIGSNGVAGSTANRYGSYGGGGAPSNSSTTASQGKNGYVLIKVS